ncbi:hypothetical protein GF386_04560 [Candidatus Pacearchaeota archaeon]|nr:hypothetical protein [Candidatus Pacearchaeota archaeon]MBD3283397.1 hypothetical protein [Candidatus Pacearchaeota archaeon]
MKLNKNQRILLIVLIVLVLVMIFIYIIENFIPKKEIRLCSIDADCEQGFYCNTEVNHCEKIEEININDPVCGDGVCESGESPEEFCGSQAGCYENPNYCQEDCEKNYETPICGDGVCDSKEIDRYTRPSCYDQGCRMTDEPNPNYCPEDCDLE